MEKKTKRILLISVAILLIGGGVGYWLWRRKQTTKEEANVPIATDDSGTLATSTGTVLAPTANGPSDIKAFQDWMDKNYPNWVKGKNLNKGSGYGSYGPSTQSAWNTYKSQFQQPAGVIGTTIPKTLTPTNVMSKGDAVYSVMRNIGLLQLPAANTLMGNITLSDEKLKKQIGVFDSYIGDFAKVRMNINGIALNRTLIKAPYFAYLYKSLIKK